MDFSVLGLPAVVLLLEQLDVTLKYPDLESGLKNVVAQLDSENMGYLGSVGH